MFTVVRCNRLYCAETSPSGPLANLTSAMFRLIERKRGQCIKGFRWRNWHQIHTFRSIYRLSIDLKEQGILLQCPCRLYQGLVGLPDTLSQLRGCVKVELAYGVTKYGSGRRKDVVNQCLEFVSVIVTRSMIRVRCSFHADALIQWKKEHLQSDTWWNTETKIPLKGAGCRTLWKWQTGMHIPSRNLTSRFGLIVVSTSRE